MADKKSLKNREQSYTTGKDKIRSLELLAPGGSLESVKAAFMAGADAVYMGGDRFSARAYAESVSEHSLETAIDYAHLHGKKLYLTLNTLLKQEEIENSLLDFVSPLYEQGLDGILVQDLGVLKLIKENFPLLPIHASTQMTVTDAAGAKLLKSLGVTRVVASRELNLKELADIYGATGMELEAFVHGAICYCYSGRCLYSSLIGGRSGNRGRCAQPCRLPYELRDADGRKISKKQESYLLSLKDMCTLEYLPQMAEAGVMSFKIEGRMKSPLYTAGIVSIYRKYLDIYSDRGGKNWKVEESDLRAVSEFFDRGGFTEYLTKHNGAEMMALKEKPKLRKPDEKLMEETKVRYLDQNLKEPVNGFVSILEGNPACVTLSVSDVSATVLSGTRVQESVNRPLTERDVRKQMNKLGDTPFTLDHLEMELSDHAFMPVKQLNELRREAARTLEMNILDSFKRSATDVSDHPAVLTETCPATRVFEKPELIVSVEQYDMLKYVLEIAEVDIVEAVAGIVSQEQIQKMVSACHAAGKKMYIRLPEIYRGKAISDLHLLTASDADGLTVSNLDELYALSECHYSKPVRAAHSVYLWNRAAKKQLREIAESLGIRLEGITVPYELNAREMKTLDIRDMQLFVYGHMPMMITANCLRKTEGICRQNKKVNAPDKPIFLIDRKNAQMPVVCNCRYCYNIIYNALPSYLLDQGDKIRELSPAAFVVSLTTEELRDIPVILQEAASLKRSFWEDTAADNVNKQVSDHYTRGHFARGVL